MKDLQELQDPTSSIDNDTEKYIIKPVLGGQFTQTLKTYFEESESLDVNIPSFIQPLLIQPEVRVYGINGEFKAFHIYSEQLDYRQDKSAQISEIEQRLGQKLDSQHGILVALIDRVRSVDNEIIRQDTLLKTILGVPQLMHTDRLAKADRDDQRKDQL